MWRTAKNWSNSLYGEDGTWTPNLFSVEGVSSTDNDAGCLVDALHPTVPEPRTESTWLLEVSPRLWDCFRIFSYLYHLYTYLSCCRGRLGRFWNKLKVSLLIIKYHWYLHDRSGVRCITVWSIGFLPASSWFVIDDRRIDFLRSKLGVPGHDPFFVLEKRGTYHLREECPLQVNAICM